MEKGRIANDTAFSVSYAPRGSWGGDPVNGNQNGMNTQSMAMTNTSEN